MSCSLLFLVLFSPRSVYFPIWISFILLKCNSYICIVDFYNSIVIISSEHRCCLSSCLLDISIQGLTGASSARMIWWTDYRASPHLLLLPMEPISFKREQSCIYLYTPISMTKWTELLVFLSIITLSPNIILIINLWFGDFDIHTNDSSNTNLNPSVYFQILDLFSEDLIFHSKTFSHDQPKPLPYFNKYLSSF